MTSPEVTIERVVANAITRRGGSVADASAIAAAARSAYDDLAVVLVPLVSQTGVDALLARALHLTRRECRLEQVAEEASGPFGSIGPWLEQQKPTVARGVACTLLATFATLLATLIGEPLTTRYLRTAWPSDDLDTQPEGREA